MNRDKNFAKTKIVATIGPGSNNVPMLEQLIRAGMDIARLNCSHAGPQELGENIKAILAASRNTGQPIAILADLGGPKIRLGDLSSDVAVETGQSIILTADPEYSGEDKIPAGYPELASDLEAGNRILIDDGLIELEVQSVNAPDIRCLVLNDGVLKSRKGINLPGVKVSLSCITEKDRKDIDFLVTQPVDYIALSFVRQHTDIRELREILVSKGCRIPIIAKIEKPEAIDDLESIVDEAEMVMVARGDLGVEMLTEEVPLLQKRIINICNEKNKPVITATQMLESMINNPRPTRAEASDVANAVFDGTDAVMLSAETSVGRYPVQAVRIMDNIIRAADQHRSPEQLSLLRRRPKNMSFEYSICHSACVMAEENHAGAIICLTKTGHTASLLSRFRSTVPILAFTESMEVVRYLNIFWGVQAELIEHVEDTDTTLELAEKLAVEFGYVKSGDAILFLAGIPLLKSPRTNMLKIGRVI